MWCLSVKCQFCQWLVYSTSLAVNCLPVTDITIHMHKNDGLENYLKKIFFFSHPGDYVSVPGVRELGTISGRLLDDPGVFTCMKGFWEHGNKQF